MTTPSKHKNPLGNLAVVVPVWNEEFLLPAKLRDLERMKPGLVIFTEGCFDRNYPLKSTDRSRDILEKFRSESKLSIEIIDAIRQSRLRSFFRCFEADVKIRRSIMLFERIIGLINSSYRSNQASTLNTACSFAKSRGMNHVFINDVDEYLSNSALSEIKSKGLSEKSVFFSEVKTFGLPPRWLPKYSTQEHKTWNGIYPLSEGFFLIPTREPRIAVGCLRGSARVDKLGYELRGQIYHITNLESTRWHLSYQVGDRKQPSENDLTTSQLPEEYAVEIKEVLKGITPDS